MDELIAYAQSIIQFLEQRGGSLNEVSQQALGALLQNVLELIEGEGVGPGAPPGPPQPPIEPGMPSSNVEGFAYDDKNKNLFVRFLGDYPNREGPVYQYQNVPAVIFDLLKAGAVPARTDGSNKWGKWWKGKVPSIGASLFTLIKNGGYSYNRVA